MMNQQQIDALIEVRSQILSARDLEHNPDTEPIDAVLREVPPGDDNRVDLALGRLCAVLPERVDYKVGWFISPDVTLEFQSVQELIETARRILRDAQAIPY